MKNKIKERILCLMLGVGVAAAVGVTDVEVRRIIGQ